MRILTILISFMYLFAFDANAYDRSFIELARSLEDKNPELFKGFKDTDFDSLEAIQKQEVSCKDLYIATPVPMFDALVERVKKHAADSEQKKLLDELQTYKANGDLNYIHYVHALLRHQALLRLKAGAACDFEKLTTELGDEFGERLFSALSSGSFSNMYKAFHVLDELFEDDNVAYYKTNVVGNFNKKKDTVKNVSFPLYGHHEVGLVYLAYMFLNNAFPIAYPDTQGVGKLHGMTMSVYAEFVHDALHMNGYLNNDGYEDSADTMMKAYVDFLAQERSDFKTIEDCLKLVQKAENNHKDNFVMSDVKSFETRKDKDEFTDKYIVALIKKFGHAEVQNISENLNKAYKLYADPLDKNNVAKTQEDLKKALTYKSLADKIQAKLNSLPKIEGQQVASSVSSEKRIKEALPYPNPRDLVASVVKTWEEKETIIREMANSIFAESTKSFNAGSLNTARYKTLMIGLFNRLHEDYFDGEAVLQANTVEDVLKAFFKPRDREIKLNKDAKDNAEQAETINRNNPFKMNVIDGQSTMSDDEILDLAARMPASMFVDNKFSCYATLTGGEVIRKPHLLGIKLFGEDGTVYKMAIQTPKTTWRLNAEHDTYLVNMGRGDVEGLEQLVVPELGENHDAANKLSTDYLVSIQDAMDKIYGRACFLATRSFDIDTTDAVNKALASIDAKLRDTFPKESHKMVFKKLEADQNKN